MREYFAGIQAIPVEKGLRCVEDDTAFYLADLTLLANDGIGMSAVGDKLFIFQSRNARHATSFFEVPIASSRSACRSRSDERIAPNS